MSELLRVFTTRAVEILSPKNINNFGIQSHPENYQSARFKSWLALCGENNVNQLKAEMTRFLLGTDSIKKIDNLGREWTKVVPGFLSFGNEITKERAYQTIKEANLEPVFGKEKSAYISSRMALADTILSLSFLKNLSHPSNMDYLSTLKVMTLVERYFAHKMQLPELDILRHFDKQVLLPACFIRTDPCNPPIENTAFPFLEVRNNPRAENRVDGCTSKDCVCKVNNECVPQSKCCAKPRIDVIDLMIVKDYTKCYQAGDLSYIKNVLEGEKLSTKHRRLERTEELIETQEEIRQFEEKYLQTEEKASLQKETENVVKQDSAFDAGVTATYNYGKLLTVVADANYSNNQSKSLTAKEVVNSSKDIIDRATKQVEAKVRKLVSTKRIFETEETNRHHFNNVGGNNISGQYLYVNKLSRAQVFNYGRKAVIDLVLPEPAELYKRLFERKFQGIEPVRPAEIKIDPKTITAENYESLVAQYGLTDVAKPPELMKESFIHFDGGKGPETSHTDMVNEGTRWFPLWVPVTSYYGVGSETNTADVTVPDGYVMDIMSTDWGFNLFNGNGIQGCYVELKIGLKTLYLNGDDRPSSVNSTQTNPYEGTQTLFLTGNNATEFHFNVKVTFILKEERLREWQMSIFTKIKEVYEKALAKYEKELAEYKKEKEEFELKEEQLKRERYNKNPFINRETEKAELKRMVISYITCQFFDQFDAMKNMVEPCGFPEMNIKEAEQEGKFVQFFEQAFNWNLITYIFYPYFWGKKCTWSDKLRDESGDLIFKKFLEAGSCRVLVPIRDGYFDYVSYFLSYGEIWGGTGTTPLPNDPHYVSVAQEIKEQKQNFYADREGTLDVTNGSAAVILNNSDHYWDFGDPTIPTLPGLNTLNINADIDREIIIDCKVYRIVSIVENTAVSNHTSWIITLERNYEGVTISNLKWSTGAIFVGAPWEFVTPTTLTFLRDKSKCLPCYPLQECEEL